MRSKRHHSVGRRACLVEPVEPRLLLNGAGLLADINTDTASSIPSQFTQFGDETLFMTTVHPQRTLWKTDGTAGGTSVVKQLPVHTDNSLVPLLMPALSDVALFFAPDAEHGNELWRTDGTQEGTYLLKDINPGAASSPRPPNPFAGQPQDNAVVINDVLYFQASDGVHGHELWRSDGTVDGTYQVTEIVSGPSGSSISRQVVMNGVLYFAATGGVVGPSSTTTLYRSDGTEGGTYAVTGGTFNAPRDMTAVGNQLFFIAASGSSFYLYKTDGVSAPVALTGPITPQNSVDRTHTAALGDLFFFTASDGTTGTELWVSNGTTAGTHMVEDLRPGTGSGPQHLVASGGLVYFTADDGVIGRELYVSDGTPGGTQLVEDILPGSSSTFQFTTRLVAHGGAVYFPVPVSTRSELWRSAGTAASTDVVRGVAQGLTSVSGLSTVAGALYFSGNDLTHGSELWRSDGTLNGTALVKDLNTTRNIGSNPRSFATIGNVAYFAASRGATGSELWRTDGTPAGTYLVMDINPGTASSTPSVFVEMGGVAYFIADDGAHGPEIWRTDGTLTGTYLVKDVVPGSAGSTLGPLVTVGNHVFFTVGGDLWKTNGTEVGTVLVKDLTADGVTAFIYDPTEHNGELYFGYGWGNQTLWKSNGTDAGTVPVKPVGGPTGVDGFTSLGNTLYFTGTDPTYGRELWKTDGTAGGTAIVKDLHTSGSSNAGGVVEYKGRGYFWATTPAYGYALWSTNGTDAGTTLVKSFPPSPSTVNTGGDRMMVAGDWLYFGYSDGTPHGYELWQSDGTEAGTRIVKELRPGSDSSIVSPPRMAYANGLLYFAGIGPTGGVELYQTNGTESGTTLTANINPGNGSSQPENLIALNGSVLFTADNSVHGVELWTTNEIRPGWMSAAPGAAYALVDDTLTVTGGTVTLFGPVIPTALVDGEPRFESIAIAGPDARVNVYPGGHLLVTKHLSITAGATLDLADNDLLWDYTGESPYATLMGYMLAGRNTGTGGIVSTRTTMDDTALAIVDNAIFGKSTFGGETIDPSSLLAMYTYFGDANLDGQVTGDDYLNVDANLGLTGAQWFQGDFNFDGKTTGDDYLAIDAHLGKGTINPVTFEDEQAEMIALHAEQFGGKAYIKKVEQAIRGPRKLVTKKPA